MAEIIALCGKICCGKTTCARRLCREKRAALLSMDEVMLALFPPYLGDRHEEIAARVRAMLLAKAEELVGVGVNVVLDWGFWSRAGRDDLRAFCRERGIPCQFRYLHIDETTWRERVAARNRAVEAGETAAYLVDANLAAKCAAAFEPPAADETDVVEVCD